MFDLMRDVRHAARRLARTPMFTVATLLTLALGIGANTAIFSIINSALLKPLPFPEPERLVGLWQTAPGVNITDLNPSIADYVTYREESRTLADVAIWNGHPFSVYSRVDTTFIDGTVYFDRQQDLARRPELAKERATLEQADPNKPPARGGLSPNTPRRRPSGHEDDVDQQEDKP